MGRVTFLLLTIILLQSGCAHVLSSKALNTANPSLTLAVIRGNPEQFIGETLILGGIIVDNQTTREGSVLEILSHELDRWGGLKQKDEHGGRFLAGSDDFLIPAHFEPGMYITLTGTLIGTRNRPLRGEEYTYPLFTMGEYSTRHPLRTSPDRSSLYLWTPYWHPWQTPHRHPHSAQHPYWHHPFWQPYYPYW